MSDRHRQIADIILAAIAAGERDAVADRQDQKDRTAVAQRLEYCVRLDENDFGNGQRLIAHFGDEFIHVLRIGFHVYDGRRWKEDEEGLMIRRRAHQVADLIGHEAEYILPSDAQVAAIASGERAEQDLTGLPPPAKRNDEQNDQATRLKQVVATAAAIKAALKSRKGKRASFARSAGNTNRIENMMKEAATYRSCTVDGIDADPLALNLQNGTLRFIEHEGEWDCRLDPHDRADRITKLLPTAYDGEATAPAFHRFLERVLPSLEVRTFLQRYFGYALTAIATEEVFCFFHGQGRNGKSTLVDLICALMADYATTVPFETLAGEDRRKGSDATPDLVRLPGSRLVRASEPEQGVRLKEGTVKQLTSREPIMVRRLTKEFIEVYPTFKMIISGNHKPEIRGTDDGIWRRLMMVPFDVQIPMEEVDNKLADKLMAERAGILAWLIEGTLWYLNEGLQPPPEIVAATAEFREESDPLGGYIEACLDLTADIADQVTPVELYAAFEKYCTRQGINLWQKTTFARRFSERVKQQKEIMKSNANGLRSYRGARIRPDYQFSDGNFL